MYPSSDEEDPVSRETQSPAESYEALSLRSSTTVAQSEARSPSPTPSFEVIVQTGGKDIIPSPFHLALGLWFEKSGCTRTEYARLREVLQLQKASADEEGEELQSLPRKLDSLKRQVRRHIPLLKLLRKALPVIIEKQPSLPQRQKGLARQRIERLSWQYWYDPVDLIRTILSATRIRDKMFFGMAQYVDEPLELWHSRAWGSSIRTTSGEVCRTCKGQVIIPGDLVRIRTTSTWRVGRVIFIGHDHRRQAPSPGAIIITLQAVAEQRRLPSILHHLNLDHSSNYEMFLVEDILLELPLDAIDRHLNVYLDRDNDDEIMFPDDRYFIRRVVNVQLSTCRPLRQLRPTRGELEVAHLGRKHVEAFLSKPHISLPYLLFIDDFGVHRNMYRALKAFYLIPACLPYEERRKLANVFTLTLGPHGAKIDDIVEAFRKPVEQLDHGMELEINGEDEAVWAFSMTLLGDMPQQADNGGFLRHTAKRGCRTCYCANTDRANLEFDIIAQGRYHWDTVMRREEAQHLATAAEKRRFTEETGIRMESPAVAKLAPALDLIQSRAYDAPHSEWRGLGRILQGFLMTSILSKRGATAYFKAFQHFPFPPGWKRIQSPAFYIWSWSLSEAGRATLLTPLILRSQSTIGWYRLPFLQAVEKQVQGTGLTPMNIIIRCFACVAQSNTLVGSQRYTDPAILHELVLEGRKLYQQLISCAVPVEGFHRDEGIGADDTDDDTVLHEMLPDASDEDLPQRNPRAKTKVTDKRVRKGNKFKKFKKLLNLPNVHAGLHLAEDASEYATVMNSNVLAGELKHK